MAVLTASTLYRYVTEDLAFQGLSNGPEFGYPDGTVRQVAAARLLQSLLKKFPDNVSPDADSLAELKFRQVNISAGNWQLSPDRSLIEDIILGEFRNVLYKFWYRGLPPYTALVENPYELLSSAHMGPGASMGAAGEDFYSKLFAGNLTSTSTVLYSMYRYWAQKRPLWAESEKTRLALCGPPCLVNHSLLSFVPKDNRISRVICTEPSLNMYYQLGLKTVLERRIKSFLEIDFSTQQSYNRKMALRSSLDDSLATIDLSSASDSVSVKMLKWALPRQFFDLLMLLRSPNTKLPSGELLPLEMISSMGNGFTFPLQTLIFAAVLRSVYTVMGEIPVTYQEDPEKANYGVYGDDIICSSSSARMVIRVLNLLGFSVNIEKSFLTGYFKESCGLDAYKGHNVRGFYLKKITPVSPYVTFNRLVAWSARTGITLYRTFRYLLSCGEYLEVPLWESDSAGFRIPLFLRRQIKYDANGSFLYRKLTPVPSLLRFTAEGKVLVRHGKRRIYNPDAHFLCAIGGYITNDTIGLRSLQDRGPSYRRKRSIAINWDRPSPEYEYHRRASFIAKSFEWGESAEAEADPTHLRKVCLAIFG